MATRKMEEIRIKKVGALMAIFNWIFVLAVVIITFFVIFRKLTKTSYWIMGAILILYACVLFWNIP
ncbi:hypothetical protein LCM20_18340 [Halobacillus litoralis]|uniref:hypothetical protein n=1 Tax=Halobacillus litoralis TaxID=45668 RepID=UPI001CD32862|nr:hypothetical protein [Halobacillus litoralis]MCA0972561.1 hypothetical protein [Halobacillus litoralis]